jgi:hypothetical protein
LILRASPMYLAPIAPMSFDAILRGPNKKQPQTVSAPLLTTKQAQLAIAGQRARTQGW